jgi:ABC-type glycerol-3-phosphate transport system permease component
VDAPAHAAPGDAWPKRAVGNPPVPVVARAASRPRHKIRVRPGRAGQYGLLIFTVGLTAVPLVWMVLSSVKPDRESAAYPPTLWPHSVTLANFQNLFRVSDFSSYLANSAFLATATTALTLLLATVAAYALTRFAFRLLLALGELSLLAYMVPPILLLVPIARIVTGAHLANSLPALVIVYTSNLLPFGLWILRSYFEGIPIELEHAAMVDGCTRFGAFYRVILPQATPGIISTGIFTFNAAWSEYLFASTLLNGADKMTLSPGLALLMDQTGVYSWGMLMAAATLVTVPVIVLFVIAQKQLVGGWGEGALKG